MFRPLMEPQRKPVEEALTLDSRLEAIEIEVSRLRDATPTAKIHRLSLIQLHAKHERRVRFIELTWLRHRLRKLSPKARSQTGINEKKPLRCVRTLANFSWSPAQIFG